METFAISVLTSLMNDFSSMSTLHVAADAGLLK